MADTLIHNVVLINPTLPPQVIPEGWLWIQGDRIKEKGDGKPPKGISENVQSLVDGEGGFLIPGLVNAHTHAAMSLFRGFADDLPLKEWLERWIFPAEGSIINPQSVYWGTMLSCWEMITNGITTFADGYFFEEQVAKAARNSGLRAIVAQGILDFPSPDCKQATENINRAKSFLMNGPWDERIRPAVFCHAPYTCSGQTYTKAKELCAEHEALLFTHAAETKDEVEEIRKRHGSTPVSYLSELGILDRRTVLVHCVWMDEREMDLISSGGSGCVICTESNMKLASGIAPLKTILDKRINVGLGTDGPASNNDLDLFGEMDLTAKVHKVKSGDPQVLDAATVLHLATRGGAMALGLEDVGLLEEGYVADLVLVCRDRPSLNPMYNPVSHLVYAARGGDVQKVWVGGRMILDSCRPLTLNPEEIRSRVKEIVSRLSPPQTG